MTSETVPYWAALATLVALLGGGGVAAAKWYKGIQHERLIAKTAELLSVSSKLDPSDGAFQSNGLNIDGPPIRLRTYLDPGES